MVRTFDARLPAPARLAARSGLNIAGLYVLTKAERVEACFAAGAGRMPS
jgi:hypothetical protein